MITTNLSTLKIHKLSQEQYNRELAAGRLDENAIYLTPDSGSSDSPTPSVDTSKAVGVWVFNDTLTKINADLTQGQVEIDCVGYAPVTHGALPEQFSKIGFYGGEDLWFVQIYLSEYEQYTDLYSSEQGYLGGFEEKTIVFLEEIDDAAFMDWLRANATKMPSSLEPDLDTVSKTIVEAINEVNEAIANVPSINNIEYMDFTGEGTEIYTEDVGILWDVANADIGGMAAPPAYFRVPIAAGEGIEFVPGEEGQIVNIGLNEETRETIENKANKSEGAFFVIGSGTTDSTAKTSTWTGTSDRITEYYDGLAIRYKIGVAGQTTTTLNINNLGAKQVYRFSTTTLTTQFPVGSIINLVYHTDLNGGCWMCNDYDANTNTYQRVYSSTNNVEYPITARYNTTTGSSYYAEYGRYSTGVTLNPSTNTITATKFKGALTGNADTATKATQDASGNVITSTYETKADATTKLNEVNAQISQLSSEIADKGQLKPEFAQSEKWLNDPANNADTTKIYVVPDKETGIPYIYAYMHTEVTIEPENIIPIVGYELSKRIKSDGSIVSHSDAAMGVTGAIPAKVGDVIVVSGYKDNSSYTSYMASYKGSTYVGKLTLDSASFGSSFTIELDSGTFGSDFDNIRISGNLTSNLSVINENSGGTIESDAWTNTGHAFVPADYEKRIIGLETEIGELNSEIGELNSEVEGLSSDIKEVAAKLDSQSTQPSLQFANSVDELNASGNKSSLYVLPNGVIYAYLPTKTDVDNLKNLLPCATTTAGGAEIYGDNGYQTGVRLSSDGSATTNNGASMLATGFISAPDGSLLDGKRVTTSGFFHSATMKCYINTYNSTGSLIKSVEWSADAFVSDFTLDATTYGTGIVFIRISADIQSSPKSVAIDGIKEDSNPNEPSYAWTSTGLSFVRASNSNVKKLAISNVFAPSPQLPADGSEGSDFNGIREYITAEAIYDKIDELLNLYPRYITKEVMGMDASDEHEWRRYICSRRAYDAWMVENHPPMYAWTNGSTTIYSVSVSPRKEDDRGRPADKLYTVPYIDDSKVKGAVTSVDNKNQSRTVGGVVYTRDKSRDVAPTLVYTHTSYSPYFSKNYKTLNNGIYDQKPNGIPTYKDGSNHLSIISAMGNGVLTGENGIFYTRYPLGDRNSKFEEIPAIVIGGNEHGTGGDPATPAMISARMIKDLCECKNANNPFLNLLKNEYMMVFCPVVNPWGLHKNNKSYYNSNGVNLDRNFDTIGWGGDTTHPQGDYGGSENETQYFMNTLVASKAKIAMCNHSYGHGQVDNDPTKEAVSGGICSYMFGQDWSKYDASLLEIAEVMASNYNLVFKSNDADGVPAVPNLWAKTRSYFASIGVDGVALEINSRDGFITDPTNEAQGKQFTARVMEAGYTQLLQVLYMMIDKAE